LFGELMGAGFVDAGQTWERRDQYLRDLAVAAGPGLLLRTPIGLARFYVAFLLTDSATGQPSTLFQIQVGHGF
jgi:outer membrane translocation and assembly module TamA